MSEDTFNTFPFTAIAYRAGGEIVRCGKCDKEAAEMVMGKESYIARCSEHSLNYSYERPLIYRPPEDIND